MKQKLSKTDYILWKECKKNAWMKWHRREAYDAFEPSEFDQALMVQGNRIEEVARTRWPEGYLIPGRNIAATELTKELVAKHELVIFQAAFATEDYFVAADVLVWNDEAGKYDLYEIKMASTEKGRGREYDFDIGSQKMAIALAGVHLNRAYLLKLNSNYVRHGELNVHELFEVVDKTEIVNSIADVIAEEALKAVEYLRSEAEPEGHCDCYFKGRGNHCTTFMLCNREVPPYGTHDLNMSHLSNEAKSAVRQLLAAGVLELDHIADTEGLTKRQKNQVQVHKSKEPIIEAWNIQEQLDALDYPLYFLDYETYPSAIPLFDGYSPYQQVVFQYSLHIVAASDSEITHEQFIQADDKDPAENLAASLKEHVGPAGSVIVWSKKFENGRNKELAEMLPAYEGFFQDLIARTYDLMDIVDKQHYVHPGFKGKSSIKCVGPVLSPDVSYGDLEVKSGIDAIEGYRQLTSGELSEADRERKVADMLTYCKLDTWAMVRIWQEFMKVI